IHCDGYVLVSVYKVKYAEKPPSDYRYGDEIQITGKLEMLPHRRNPGEFDYGKYLKMHDVDAVFIAFGFDKIERIGHTEPSFLKSKIIYPIKDYSIKVIDKLVGGDEGEYLKGLVLGERSNISQEIKENFVNAGVAHIIAVSGLNVAYVALIIWAVLMFVPVKHSYKNIIIIIFLFLYMGITGSVPSIVRATIMASVFLIAQIIERKPNAYNIVAFAGLVILIYDPRQLFDAGFILSFTAIFSIIILYPKLNEWLRKMKWYANLDEEKIFGKSVKWILLLFLGTFAAQLGTLPISSMMFNKVSVVSLAANLFAIPLSNLALALGFIMIIASTFSSWLASIFAAVNSMIMHYQLEMIEFCAKLDFAFVETYFVDYLFMAVYFIVLALLYGISKSNYKLRAAVIILLIANFVLLSSIMDKTDKVQITYIDVGSSNSTLIKMPLGTSVLINTGSDTKKYSPSERNVIPYLKTQGIGELDLLIITALNANEFRSLNNFVKNFPVKKILIPVYYKPVFENELINTSFKNTKIYFVENSQIVNKQGKFRIYLYYDSLYNGESMMAQFTYGDQSFIFTDSYSLNEDFLNTKLIFGDDNVQVLKTAGAGSFDYSSAEFLAKANPEFVVISSSRSTRKKMRTDIFTASLEHIGMNVLKTNENGALIFESDGEVTESVNW
ncbi:MAG: DNA internalization-related competence protein ComEC/Rec2, partial [Chlorobi bacterium]|nr:DNA internalization-related competence protein ComEC/Rec2 [Chlorobiota bacterium]